MPKFMLIGPLTRDIISRDNLIYHSTGGAVYYQASVLSNLDVNVTAVITLSNEDKELLNVFPQDVDIIPIFFDKTMKFENIYPDNNTNNRIQKATIPENPIKPENLPEDIGSYDAILLCPLYPSDIPIETIEHISNYNIPIYMGAQGYLRELNDNHIILKPWDNFEKFLRLIKMFFIDETEAKVMTGKHNLSQIGEELSNFGPQEVIITCGDRGAIIYSSINKCIYKIPAFTPLQTADPTGLGDTYMAAYARKRMETSNLETCGIFAAMVATMKLEKAGPFQGNITSVNKRLQKLLK